MIKIHGDFRKVIKHLIVVVGIWVAVLSLFKIKKLGVSKTLKSMQEVQLYVEKKIAPFAKEDVLCALDIDLTLLQPDHPAFFIPNVRKHIRTYRKIEKPYSHLDKTLPFVYSFLHEQRLVDNHVYDLLKVLNGIKTIAFTATFTGPMLHFKRLEQLRYEQLKEKNICFEGQFSDEDFVLNECPPYRSHYPCFYKGVLCSNSENGTTTKGTVLCAFLRKINWTPKCIVLVDDRTRNLQDVAKSLKKDFPTTKFIGIEFLGAHHYCPKTISKDDFHKYWEMRFMQANQL